MRNKILMLMIFMLAIPIVSGFETNFNVVNNTFYPGEEKVIGTVQINTNESVENIMIWTDIRFQEQFEIIQIAELNNESYKTNITAFVPDFYPENVLPSNIFIFFTNVQNVSYNITFYNETTNQTENITVEYQTFTPELITLPFNITVLGLRSFEAMEQINLTAKNNQTLNIEIPIYNSGNKNLNLNFFSSELSLNRNVTLFPDQNITIDFDYLVPLDLEPTNHTFIINITDDELQKLINLTLFIFDDIEPEVNVTFSKNLSYGDTQHITITPTDNIAIDHFHVEIYNPNGSFTKFVNQNEIDFSETKQKGDYEINVFANDSSNNLITATEVFNVSGLKAIILPRDDINFKKIKTGKSKSELFINIEIPVNTTIILRDLVGLESIKINPVAMDEVELKNNENVTITTGGEVYIIVESENVAEFSGVLSIQTDSYVDLIKNEIEFYGEFVDYIPPQPYNTLLFGQYPMNCSVDKPDDLENGSYQCYTKYPLRLDLDTLTVPVAPTWITEMKNNYNNQIKEKESVLFTTAIVMWGFIIFAILLVIIIYYSQYIYPTLRRRAKW